MPNRVFKDPDLRHFSEKLRYTPEGKNYIASWVQLNTFRKMATASNASNRMRQSYIRAADACSDALSDLEKRHQWPP